MALHYIEDWLLCMYGAMSADGTVRRYTQGPISLATYDKKFVNSVSSAIEGGTGLTDRQLLLAVKVITKYEKQWAALGVSPAYLLDPNVELPLRIPLREVDRSCSISRDGKTIQIVFPYNSTLISEFYNKSQEAAGNWEFVKEGNRKVWKLDFTEGNIFKLAQLPLHNVSFEISDEMKELLALAGENYAPTIDLIDKQLVCTNVPKFAMQAMEEHGFNPNGDPLRWALLSVKFGLKVGPTLSKECELAKKILTSPDDMSSYTGSSSITWDEFDKLVEATNFNFLFHYRNRDLAKLEKEFNNRYNDISRFTFLEASMQNNANNKNKIMENITSDLKNTILVTDLVIGSPRSRDILSFHCLGMLYMIPDNRRIDASVQTNNQR